MQDRYVKTSKRFYIANTTTYLQDAAGKYVEHGDPRIQLVKIGQYTFSENGITTNVIKYKTLKSKEGRINGQEKNRMINLQTEQRLVDKNNRFVDFGDSRIKRSSVGKKYFFVDEGSEEQIPVKKYWSFKRGNDPHKKKAKTMTQAEDTNVEQMNFATDTSANIVNIDLTPLQSTAVAASIVATPAPAMNTVVFTDKLMCLAEAARLEETESSTPSTQNDDDNVTRPNKRRNPQNTGEVTRNKVDVTKRGSNGKLSYFFQEEPYDTHENEERPNIRNLFSF